MSATIHPALTQGRRLPNLWDAAAIVCVFAALIGVAHEARGTFMPISAPHALAVSLDPGQPAGLRGAHHDADVRRSGRLAAVHLHLCHRRREEPARQLWC